MARVDGKPAARAGDAGLPAGPDPDAAVEVRALEKHYGEVAAVDGVTFSVAPGEVFAFLGPNGAGKSTTIKILCTLADPTAGSAWVAGHDVVTEPQAVRLHIGLVFQEQTLDDQLTADENLRFHAVMYRVPRRERSARIARVLELVDLSDRRHDLVSTFSGGMARRLEIARAMLHTPSVLFLDEPTIGLDPQTRALMWDDVLGMRAEEEVTVFLTTHYMEEAEVADRIAIIDQGRIVALDTPEALKATIGKDTVDLHTADDPAALAAIRDAGYRAEEGEGVVTVFTENGEDHVARLVEVVGGGVATVHVHRPTLDDVFMHYTGRQIRDVGGETRSAMARAWGARRR
ncbi:MAG TPA: ATP-binding cassette domain-containing protein [Acidimicrobiales bacterium]|nr:ATP-binding cassette domain-containing protein [Acidimicrobiales bacterium]